MADQVSNRVGDYEILEFIGVGGMGKVFKVRNVISDRIEAMKVLLPELTAQDELIKRFLHEIKLLATLEHPNIAALHTATSINGQFVMVMEYVEGSTIAKLLQSGPIPVDKAINYTEQTLTALAYAHAKGIIHRDIKPANMMLTPDGTIKLMDFGIARSNKENGMTMVGTTLGSLYYMSPEQVKGEPIDGRSDLYALGISLYEMVTGHRPFETGTDYSIMAAHLKEAPKPPIEWRPDLPAALNEIILMAVAKDPAQRFQSPDAMRHALEGISEVPSSPATTPSITAPAANAGSAPATSPSVSAPTAGGATAAFAAPPPPPASAPSMPAMAAAAPTPSPTGPKSTYVPMPAAPPATGHRGLWMTLGALIVVAVLVVAGLYIPKMNKTHAGADATTANPAPLPTPNTAIPAASTTSGNSGAATTTSAASPDTSSSTPAPTTDNAAQPATTPSTTAIQAAAPHKRSSTHGNVGQGSAADYGTQSQSTSAADAAQHAADEQALKQLEHESDLLGTRIATADASLTTMKNAQAQQGLGLRGDIVAAQERLHANHSRLQAAIQNGDLKAAKRYMDLCDRDAQTLDTFLGH